MAATAAGGVTRNGSCAAAGARDLEAFARRHQDPLNKALGVDLQRCSSDVVFLYLFNNVHLKEFSQVLQTSIVSQIPSGPNGLEQLVCDVKKLHGSAIETEKGNHRIVAQVMVYARDLGVAMAQKTYDTQESSERAALQELLSGLDLESVLIQVTWPPEIGPGSTSHRYTKRIGAPMSPSCGPS